MLTKNAALFLLIGIGLMQSGGLVSVLILACAAVLGFDSLFASGEWQASEARDRPTPLSPSFKTPTETDNLTEQLATVGQLQRQLAAANGVKEHLKQEIDNLKEQLQKQVGTKKATSAPCNGPARMSKDLEAKLFSGNVEMQHDIIAFVNETGLQPRLCNKCDAEDAEAEGRS
mmetsp:Transcript_6655/g.15684  ORF Transcript_6655/g.15684 Transcript_6655/m.15684 type:complete len:173 (-) Transcript_6655:73-591(-)